MAPTDFDNPTRPLLAYRAKANGILALDDRLIVERVEESVRGGGFSDCVIRWEKDELADGTVAEPELTEADLADRYGPTSRVAIVQAPRAGQSLSALRCIAHGYCEQQQLQLGGSSGGGSTRRRLKVRDVLRHTARTAPCLVQGRWMLAKAIRDVLTGDALYEDPTPIMGQPWDDLAAHVPALPAIFNAGGKPNRMRKPVQMHTLPAAHSIGPIHLFTYDGDPEAEYWTYLQALRYLALIHLPKSHGLQVGPGALFDEDQSGPVENPYWAESEDDVAVAGDVRRGWREFMVRTAAPLACEGMDLLEALTLLVTEAGIDFTTAHSVYTQGFGNVSALTNLRFFAPGDTEADYLVLEKDGAHFDDAGRLRAVQDITAANNVTSANLAREHGQTVSRVRVIGDRTWKTVEVELKPLWAPDARWDDVASAAADGYRADAYSASDPFASLADSEFARRYHRQGDLHTSGENMLVGRLWGIDPAGELDPAVYDRENPPYDDYDTPWEDPSPTAVTLVRRRRVMRVVPTIDGRPPIGVRLELSADSGDTSSLLETQITVLPDRTAILLTARDLLSVGSSLDWDAMVSENFYDAYLRGFLRLFAMFEIDQDRVLTVEAEAADSPVADAGDVYDTGLLKCVLRPGAFAVNDVASDVPAELYDLVVVRDDEARAEHYAEALLATRCGAAWRGPVNIPWHEIDRYPLGTPIEGVRRDRNSTAVEIAFGGSTARNAWPPQVIQRIWLAKEQSTRLVLGDWDMAKAYAPPGEGA